MFLTALAQSRISRERIPLVFFNGRMPRRRDPLPEDQSELMMLCRAGRLFAVEEWIRSGKRIQPEPGFYSRTPFGAAVATGFHSLIEVLLRAGVDQQEKDHALRTALDSNRLDLIELLAEYGADLRVIGPDLVIWRRNPIITMWFIDRGLDMEKGWPIAHAFKNKHRDFLGVYMSIRDKIPTARHQANMALRFHAMAGNLKWVSLLLWAGGDPRAEVPCLENKNPEQWCSSALEEAVIHSRFEVLKKIGIDPSRDNPSNLLAKCWMCRDQNVVRLLLDAGADPNSGEGDDYGMRALMRNFELALDPMFSHRSPEVPLACLELAAARGGRWQPQSPDDYRTLRRSLMQASPYTSIQFLNRLVKAEVFTGDVFKELMKTPRMRELLQTTAPGSVALRQLAAVVPARKRMTRSDRRCER